MTEGTISATEAAELKARHAEIFHRPLLRRLLAPVGALTVASYLIFSWFFFDVPGAIANAQWDRAQTYIADWYSWEATPRFRFRDGAVDLEWTRSLLGDNPDPDWITRTSEGAFEVAIDGAANRVEIVSPTSVVAVVGGRSYPVPLGDTGAVLPADAPPSMSIKSGRVTVDYGFAGLAEIRNTQVYVRKRFVGWPNFFFDTKSPFFGMSPGELWTSVTAGPQLDARWPNWQFAILEFLYNSEWQHLDVYNKLLQTIVMAFVGTLFAAVLAFPLSFIAARNITPNRVVVGSSRVDLQACKLEYSIVSPK